MKEVFGEAFDLLRSDAYDSLCILTNGFVKANGEGVMGRGIAKKVCSYIPHMPRILGNKLQMHGNHVQELMTTSKGNMLIMFPTKDYWYNSSDPKIILQSCKELNAFIEEKGLQSVLLPRPGCGNGGLDWEDVKLLIEDVISDKVSIVTYSKMEPTIPDSVAVTGHRPHKLGKALYDVHSEEALAYIEFFTNFLKEHKTKYAISGMALGVDTLFALAVLGLKKQGVDIKLECAIPCKGQECRWNSKAQAVYNNILRSADVVTTLAETYTPRCMQDRNEYMVNKCAHVLAIYDGSKGGTGNCVAYAKQRNKAMTIIEPCMFKGGKNE